MSKPTSDLDPRLVRALAHPLRVRILSLLEGRTASPKELAFELGVPLQNVSYHVRALRDHGLLELERTRMVRGAVEHRYRTAARPQITAEAWAQLPAVVREAFDAAAVEHVFDEVTRAAAQGKLARPESHLSRQAMRLDEQGFKEAEQVLTAALDRLLEIESEAKARAGDEHTDVPAVAIVMLFDAPAVETSAPARRRRPHASRAEGEPVPARGDAYGHSAHQRVGPRAPSR